MQSNQIDSLFFQPNFFRDTKNPSKLGSFPFRKKSHHQTSDQEGGRGEGRAQLLRVLPRNNVGIDVVHVSSLDEGLTWGIHIFFFGNTHTKNPWLLDFWPKCLACKISTKICWSSPPRGWLLRSFRQPVATKTQRLDFPEKPGTVGTRVLPSLELPRVSGRQWTFLIYSPKQIETKSGSKKSPTVGPTERTPKKPEYHIARSQLT